MVNHLKELKKKIQNIIHFSILKNVFTYEQFFIEYSIDSYTCVCNMNFFFFCSQNISNKIINLVYKTLLLGSF